MADGPPPGKPLEWVGSSRRDIRRLPEDVKDMFEKKSKHGIATPKKEIDIVKARLKQAIEHHRSHYERHEKSDARGPEA